ncbi:hypothetical protein HAX54_028344, partial [Datura stramonium]|nr:hypothetical protein [Datura stramonium]
PLLGSCITSVVHELGSFSAQFTSGQYSLLYCQWNLCLLSLLLRIGEPVAVHRYHPTEHRCCR